MAFADKEKEIKYKNDFAREKYDHIGLIVPKGKRDIIKYRAASLNKSVNAYITDLIEADINNKS